MPALASEVAEARREGVQFHFLTLPVRILGEGRVQGLGGPKNRTGGTGRRRASLPGARGRLGVYPGGGYGHHRVGQTADFSFFGPGLGFDTSSTGGWTPTR